MNGKKAISLIILLLILDQALKIYIKTHFVLGESYPVTNWFQILFVENRGMAFGIEPGGTQGKLFLTIVRIIAVFGIGYWLYTALKKRKQLLALTLTLILAGALGNIIDSVFYGKIFSGSFHQPATLFPKDGGYGEWFHGKVVDMFYFPLFEFKIPEWIPGVGGQDFIFFNAIFNLADSYITIGVILMILFNKRVFGK